MPGWADDIERLTLDTEEFRRVVFTGEHLQLTVMRIAPGEDIGLEVHHHLDQFLRLEQGRARVTFGSAEDRVDETHEVEADWAIIVPAGTWHNVVNIGDEDVKIYSVYAPPQHPDGTVHRTRQEADEAEHG